MVMIITGVQFSHVFLLAVKAKNQTTKVLSHMVLLELKDMLLNVIWKSCKSGGRSKKLPFKVHVLYLILPLISYRNQNKDGLLSHRALSVLQL